MDTGSGRHGQSPDVRRATSQAKRFKSKGSSPRTSTVDFNRYGGVRVRVSFHSRVYTSQCESFRYTVDSNRYGGVKVRVTLTLTVCNTRM